MTDFDKLKDFYADKKVFITGHTGFKGSYLCLILSLLGAKVYGYALKPDTDPCLFDILYGKGMSSRTETELAVRLNTSGAGYSAPERAGRPELRPIEESHIGDIRDLDALESLYTRIEPDIVIHMAAQPIVRVSYRIPRETYEINVMGTVNLLECVRRHPCCKSFLNVTTDKVYFNDEEQSLPEGYAFREEDRLDGFDPYANSKTCSEIITHSYASSFLNALGVSVSTARAGNCLGGGDFAPDRIIPDCVRAVIAGNPIEVRNPGSVRPYQHVFEPLFAYLDIVMSAACDPSCAGWYNVGPDISGCVTTGELAAMFAGFFGEGASVLTAEERDAPHEAGLLRLDNTRIREVLGWESVWDIKNAVKAAADWTKAWRISPGTANETLIDQLDAYIKGISLL